MDYSLLGPTGVKVSQICLGTATFGVAPGAQEAEHVVQVALDLGINFFDTANVRDSGRRHPGTIPARHAHGVASRRQQ
jgi:aryl-alcohol dehydrogenase-like predicted oxidoreductase